MSGYRVQLIGNLGNNPEVRIVQNGGRVVTLYTATSESWKDRSSGGRKQRIEWRRVVIFTARASARSPRNTSRRARRSSSKAHCAPASGRTSPAPTATAPRSLTHYDGTRTFLDARKDDARSSEQHATREQAGGNHGMTPKFDDEIPFAPCWQ